MTSNTIIQQFFQLFLALFWIKILLCTFLDIINKPCVAKPNSLKPIGKDLNKPFGAWSITDFPLIKKWYINMMLSLK